MHKALGYLLRSARSVKTQMGPTPRPTLKLVTGEQGEQESNQEQQNFNENSKHDYFAKGALFGLVMLVGQKIDDTVANMFFWGSGLQRNKIKNRAFSKQVSSNDPIEDRLAYDDLTSVDGFVASVFDGHGGWQLSEFASKSLHNFLDHNFKVLGSKTPTDEQVIAVINKSFDEVEHEYREVARQAYDMGFPGLSKVGSCALLALVINNKLYVANAGDCKGIMFRKLLMTKGEESGKTVAIKLNNKLNACSKAEQERLKKEFPDEDIFVCKKGNPNACYVKGRLMPTRAFGDYYLKHKEFNNPRNLDKSLGGPYITHRPEIMIFPITSQDKGFLLSSDGLYDELKTGQVLKLFEEKKKEHPNLVIEKMIDAALENAAKTNNLKLDELKRLNPGKNKRNIHDDLTLLYINLDGQAN